MTLRLTYIKGARCKSYRMTIPDSTSITQRTDLFNRLQLCIEFGLLLPQGVSMSTYYKRNQHWRKRK